MTDSIFSQRPMITRRTVLKGAATAATLLASPAILRAQGAKIKLGAPFHRTGIGASYGRWYERTAVAALKLINEGGGINGMEVEMIVEDDGTDPKRGTEVVEKFATEHKVDAIFGHLFSHVVAAAEPVVDHDLDRLAPIPAQLRTQVALPQVVEGGAHPMPRTGAWDLRS